MKKIDNVSFPRGIIEAVFIDEEATGIRITFQNDEGTTLQEVCTVDASIPMFQDLMKLTTLEEIDEDTIEHTKNRVEEWKQFEAFKENSIAPPQPLIQIDDSAWNLDSLLDTITINFTKEDLFTLKLKIFENEAVRISKDRETRSLIRRAETPLDALVHYHKILYLNRPPEDYCKVV